MTSNTPITTPRLILRQFEISDAAAVLRLNSDSQVTKYTGDKNRVTTIEQAADVIKTVWQHGYQQDGYARLAVIDRQSGQLIGFCGLKYLAEYQMADIGYRFLPQFWGKGLATEGAQAMMEYGFKVLKLDKIMAMAMTDNISSTKVLQKIGLKAKGQIIDSDLAIELFEVSRAQYLNNQPGQS